MKTKRMYWSDKERQYLEACFFLGIPRKFYLEHMNRTYTSVAHEIYMLGLSELRETVRDDRLEEFYNRYARDLTLERSNGHNIEWTHQAHLFIKKCVYIGISYENIAQKLNIHRRTIEMYVKRNNLQSQKYVFFRRYTSFYWNKLYDDN